ncbi:hypothetical protein F5Y19DRAFT_197665 [Xylariaceae sp. FL1651]|nr:hypothetical protein F5Y19DRAFT_197665 [Xylariaceae sp. FL1651]
MEDARGLSDSPGAVPLQPVSHDRVNHQNTMLASIQSDTQRDSDVHDKIRQFNNLAHLHPANTVSMSKQLERKTADAALRRAMIGREEAETEMRRYREEARALRKQVEEGRERERKVGERLETVMESYGRAKETYSHTQAIWEKEIRRARKETFKSQSSIVKLQEELKSARASSKSVEECLEREKELSKAREQEAFASRYQLVGLQEELGKAQEHIRFLEQERDAFKAAAQSEEVARIAAEGRLPLPPEDPDSEFASPKKGRESLSTFEIVSSAAAEAEIEELTRLWQWERQRADRTQEHLEFVQAEHELHHSRPKSHSRRSTTASPRKERPVPVEIVDPSDLMILGKETEPTQSSSIEPRPQNSEGIIELEATEPRTEDAEEEPTGQPERKEPRRGTIFVPAEGIFRTISQQELEAIEQSDEATIEPPTPVDPQPNPPHYSRTPSVEPPSFALMVQERTSLLSLLNAPRESESHYAFNIPSTAGDTTTCAEESDPSEKETGEYLAQEEVEFDPRPHTAAAFYTVTTTTTVPIHDENVKPDTAPLTSTYGRTPSFDVNNPALTPTMTREQALAQIRERRGRARSAMQGAMTPRKQMVTGVGERRDVSAPVGRTTKSRT